eukprot:gene11986-16046_t
MSIKLRDLIRAVRACKTAAEERAVISKECALIRTAIKEEDEQFRHRNVAKLLFIHMLGYATHFGQMECLKLISAPTFPEKRIGYLGLTLLLTEQTEVLTLVTNSLKLDLTNSNQYIQALSLIAIGNLSTQDMARDLSSDVEKLLKSNNSYLRKKATLATIRLIKKEPDLIEYVLDKVPSLLKDRAHGVLITTLQLLIEILLINPEIAKPEFIKLVPSLIRLLRNFISMGFSPEHDVSGITDPFMQVKLLQLLRILGKGSEDASDQMNDVLAQVATNTESMKNAGNAILYECVQTIMEVESDSSLRVLAVNILGRFLLNRDNNIRYVALNSLSRVVAEDIGAVQRHRNTIVDCLKDPDISIRQRALELIYQLVNDQNVVGLTAELLNYLIVAQVDHKANLVSKIMQIVEKYSPTKRWRVETIITMLSVAGNITDESVPRTAIIFIAQSEGLQGYATHRLYRCLLEDSSQLGLLQVAIWCIGEYGSLLTKDCNADGESTGYSALSEEEILNLLDRCLRLHNVDVATKALILNALVKLTVRLSVNAKGVILALIAPFKNSMSLELQQRSSEYSVLLTSPQWSNLRAELLDKMPVLDEAAIRKRRAAFDDNTFSDSPTPSGGLSPPKPSQSNNSMDIFGGIGSNNSAIKVTPKSSSLLDLDDIFGGSSVPITPQNQPIQPTLPSNNLNNGFNNLSSIPQSQQQPDLLSQLFSNTAPTLSPSNQFNPPSAPNNNNSIDLLSLGFSNTSINNNNNNNNQIQQSGINSAPPMIALSPVSSSTIKAFDKGGFQVFLDVSKPNASDVSLSKVVCKFSNLNASPLEGLVFQAAVPKYLKLEMFPPSSTTIPPNSTGLVTQEIKLNNSMQGQKNIMLKLKIGYTLNGVTVEEMAQVSNFPPLY